MDAALAASLAELLKMGLAGIVILGLGVAVITLYRDNKKQQADAQAVILAILEKTSVALTKASESMDSSADALKGVQTSLQNMVTALERRR